MSQVQRRVPRLLQKSSEKSTASTEKQTARLEINDTEHCPVCQELFTSVIANGLEAKYCQRDSIVFPTKDQ